jgi:hypothetical protein
MAFTVADPFPYEHVSSTDPVTGNEGPAKLVSVTETDAVHELASVKVTV